MRRCVERGDRPAAARQFRRLREELSRLGAEPSEETRALERELMRGPAIHAPRLLPGPLHGRERELAAAQGALRRAAGGDGGALLVTGSVGIGKTRMIEAVLAEAERLGFHTLRGAGHEAEGRTPYAPARGGARPARRRAPGADRRVPESAQLALSRLLPSVRRPARLAEEPSTAVRLPRGRGVRGRGRRGRGVVLAIDDLSSVDEATMALVHHLTRSAAGQRLLVVAGMCDEPLLEAVALVRSRMIGHGAAIELALGPLDAGALGRSRWRGRRPAAAASTLDAIRRSAAGNPFFAEQLSASVDASGEVTVSAHLREVVGERLEPLEPFGEPLLAALAVIEDGFTARTR